VQEEKITPFFASDSIIQYGCRKKLYNVRISINIYNSEELDELRKVS